MIVVLLIFITVLSLFLYGKYFRGRNNKTLESAAAGQEFGLKVTVLDVGQGNCAVISCGGETMLIDTGTRENSKKIKNFLEEQKVERLKYAVASHPHSDHMGGMGDIIYLFRPEKLFTDGLEADSASYRAMMRAAEDEGTAVSVPEPGESFMLGEAEITVLSPGKSFESVNDMSLVLRLEYREKVFLFMGDAGTEAEEEMLSGVFKSLTDCDILIAGHHGSSDASSEAFVRKASPVEAVISCGAGNEYGHPHRETTELFEKLNIKIRRTDIEGDIAYGVDDGGRLLTVG